MYDVFTLVVASLALLAHDRSCGDVVGANRIAVIKHSNAYDGST